MSKNEFEVRCISTELRATSEQKRTIEGYAAIFDSWSEPIMGLFKEKIDERAFDGCDMSDVIMCFNHDINSILARSNSGTLALSVDERGLKFSFDAPNTTLGNDMLELVRRGDISKCSFRFVVEKDSWVYADPEQGHKMDERFIYKISLLRDVSLVVFPAYQETEISLRQLEERKNEYMQSKQKDVETISTSYRDRQVQFINLKK
ncbi:MAG: HK97 family phage prohead protease [Rikenellaceae bacterium]